MKLQSVHYQNLLAAKGFKEMDRPKVLHWLTAINVFYMCMLFHLTQIACTQINVITQIERDLSKSKNSPRQEKPVFPNRKN